MVVHKKDLFWGDILNATTTTNEIIHSMEKNKRPRMAFKLDISKGYNKVKWDFLYDALKRVRFNEKAINLITMMVGSVQ